ncbi:hypothetical protein [Pseudoalteromonas galatheae]|uniref:hypothetical protein n=1 Tax=Pseudoalteromonas galatheae TaxID=579562 RepID=UPI0030CA8A91
MKENDSIPSFARNLVQRLKNKLGLSKIKLSNNYGLTVEYLNYLNDVVIRAIKDTNCDLIVIVGRCRTGKSVFCKIANELEGWKHIDLGELYFNNSFKKVKWGSLEVRSDTVVMFDEIQCLENPTAPIYHSKQQKTLITTQTCTCIPELSEWDDSYLKIEFERYGKPPVITLIEKEEA